MAKHVAFSSSVVKLLQAVKAAEAKPSDAVHCQLLVGHIGEDKVSILACVACPGQGVEDVEKTIVAARALLPGGVKFCGVAILADDRQVKETCAKLVKKYGDVLTSLDITEPVVSFLSPRDSSQGICKVFVLQADEKLVEPQFSTVYDDLLKNFIVARTTCQIPLSFMSGNTESWQTLLHNEMERLQEDICSDSTMFHLQSSSVILSMGNNYGLPEDSICDYLPVCILDEEEEEIGVKKKKTEKSLKVIHFDVYHDLSNTCSLERAPTCAPIINYSLEPHKTVSLTLPIDTAVILDPSLPVSEVAELLCTSISDQLVAIETCLCQFAEDEVFHTPVPYHFKPMNLPVVLTAMLPHGLNENSLENHRKSLHNQLCLPTDRPLFRRANQFMFPDEQDNRGYLTNVHEGLPPSKVKEGNQYIVDGQYTYHHYMQDRFDDNKWGCAYRSLQTLVSWFRLQGYTDAPIPGHKEIQQALVDVGDKEPNFVGSRKWIGSMEVSFCLDHLIGVTSRIMSVNSGADLAGQGRELAAHFSTQGTPIMIGGGVLAHTILGIDYNEVTGDINFLILDPHYTGAEDLKVIQDKGWCGWKGPEFWDPNTYYNLCMPQRHRVI